MYLAMSTLMCILHIMLNLLDPLLSAFARLTVARGILFPDLIERLKHHYIDAATDMTTDTTGGKVTDSRLSVLTGLQRRDIVRLRELPQFEQAPNHLARLVALWQTEPDYSTEGTPNPLAKNGPAPSFEALARIVRRDVHPRTMLDTLQATGTIAIKNNQTVQLLQTSYQPLAGSEDQLAYLANNAGDHLNAATDNVLGHTPPHFERAVHYTQLTTRQIEELKAEFDAGQMALLERLSKKAADMKKLPSENAHDRFRAGGYFYHTSKGEQ